MGTSAVFYGVHLGVFLGNFVPFVTQPSN